jgi:enediyne biosynthesis protein E4
MQFNLLILALAAAPALAETAATTPRSTPLFAPRNPEINHQYTGGWEHFVGGGLASFDCNGDQRPELYAAGGETPAILLRNQSAAGGPVDFTPDTPAALALKGVTGAYPLDIDSDGITDLAVLRVGENLVLRGLGDCRFAPFDDLGFSSRTDGWTTAFSATWETGQSMPTLAFGNYVDRSNPEGPFGTCDSSSLYRPQNRAYPSPIALKPGYCPLSILFTDWARTGRADLRMSNDRHYYVKDGEEQLWAMEETPRPYSRQDGWKRYMIWGMGIASRDLTGDGLSEVYLSSMGDQKLQTLSGSGRPEYIDATYERGTTAHRPYTGDDGRPSTGWHVAFGDVQNDGLDDIFIAKGNVEQMPGAAMADPNNLLLQNQGGTFSESGDLAGIGSMARSRGAVLADFNNDGLLDLAVVNRRAAMEIYQNVSPDAGNWIAVMPQQTALNRDAIGAFIELRSGDRIQTREITIGGGHAGGNLGPQHFGLGDATSAQVRVIWPDGTASDWRDVATNQMFVLTRDGQSLAISAN